MAISQDSVNMALFCDFENVALGVRDANYDKFDIKRVLERLLLKGSIVVKKAYCDWERYKGFKSAMHEANFELIEIPHVRQSGKNSADIRLVVDALDLCYTKSHVDTFVIISGDSDFSPLVSKLRENAKQVIGVGVKDSTSDLLVANCDEFIFYDDLVRDASRAGKRDGKDGRDSRDAASGQRRAASDDERRRKNDKSDRDDLEARRSKAIAMVVETFDALMAERGDTGKIWASIVKQTLKRRRPDFNESYYGFKAFGNLLDEAQRRGLLECGRDEKSGTYVYRPGGLDEEPGESRASVPDAAPAPVVEAPEPAPARGHDAWPSTPESSDEKPVSQVSAPVFADVPEGDAAGAEAGKEPEIKDQGKKGAPRKTRSSRKTAKAATGADAADKGAGQEKPALKQDGEGAGGRKASRPRVPVADAPSGTRMSAADDEARGGSNAGNAEPPADDTTAPPPAKKKAARKIATRTRRPRKSAETGE